MVIRRLGGVWRRALVVASLLLVTALLALADAAPSSAAPGTSGTWGVGQFPYANGILCLNGTQSVPLASWNLGPTAPTAFLTTGIESSNGVDSAAPPFSPAAGALSTVVPGSLGFTSAGQIAAVAYLITHEGSAPAPVTVAEVAELISELVGSSTGQGCLDQGVDGLSRADADALWTTAQKQAGPDKVVITVTPPVSKPGVTVVPKAVVTSALGYPVVGATVTFRPGGTTAVTNADGIAAVPITPPVTPGQSSLVFSASVSASIALTGISVPNAAPAVVAAAPTTVTSSATVQLDQSANPTVRLATSTTLTLPGKLITSTVAVTGLNGHSAGATIMVAGPLPADAKGSCSSITPTVWASGSAAHSLGQTSVNLFGDQTVPGPAFTPTGPGCYSLSLRLTTNDAVPAVTRAIGYGAPGSTVTVLPVGLQVVATHQGVALPGALTATATVVHSLGATASIAGTVLGPLRPVSGSCSSADWTQASVAVQLPSTSITGDGPHRIASAPVTSLGCYALQLRAVFTVSSGGSLTIPVAAGSAAPTFLVLDPVMQVTGAPTWAPAGTAVHVGVAVLGSLHQAGALQLALWRVAPPLTGCPAAKWTAAALISTGASQPTTGDASYAMTAPAARTPGCYRVVPSLTLTAIGSPTAATTDLSLAQFQVTGVAAAFVAPTPPKTDDRWRTWTALSVAAASVLTAIGQAAWLARRMRNADDG